jgi:FkbM family methyltransferase
MSVFELSRENFEAECRIHASGEASAWARVFGGSGVDIKTVMGDRSVSPHLLHDGFWESWITLALSKIVRPGMNAVNIGANLGYYTTALRMMVGEEGFVTAYEPQPSMASALEATIDNAGWENVVLHDVAVGRGKTDHVHLHVPSSLMGSASVYPVPDSHVIDVQMVDLDWSVKHDDAPDIIFCDAEGSEQDIFLGSRVISDHRPIVVLEFAPINYTAPNALLRYFGDLGYGSYRADFQGNLVPFDGDECVKNCLWTMMFFLPEGTPHSKKVEGRTSMHYGEGT